MNILRKLVFCAACIGTCGMLWLVAPGAWAHELETDGTISGILHFEPDDSPTSGVPVSFILFMNDSAGHFSLAKCDCAVTAIENGKVVATTPLKPDTQSFPSGTITFPRAGTYELIVHGTPKVVGAFQPFTLHYSEAVAQGPATGPVSATTMVLLGSAVVIASASLGACWLQFRSNKHNE